MSRPFYFLLLNLFCLTQVHANQLIVGSLVFNPPFEMVSHMAKYKQLMGFEVQIVNEVCRRIRQNCMFKGVLFSEIEPYLQNGNIDLAIGAIVITPERKKHFLFSLPYKKSHMQFMTLASREYKNLNALTHKRIAVYHNSPGISFALQLFKNNIIITKYMTSLEMLEALKNNVVDALVTNEEQSLYWQANFDNLQLLGGKYLVGEGYGIMATRNRGDLMKQIDQALTSMKADGSLEKIYNENFMWK